MKSFLSLCFAILIFSCYSRFDKFSPVKVNSNTMHQSVGILEIYFNDDRVGTGTGFSIGEHKILTVNHVCESIEQPGFSIRLAYEDSFQTLKVDEDLSIIKRDESKDLCLLYIVNNPLRPIAFSDDSPKKGDKIFVFGVAHSQTLVLTQGYYGSFRWIDLFGKKIYIAFISASTVPGNSGSPILNEDGEFIGVAIGAYHLYDKLAIGSPYFDLKTFLEEE